MRKVDTGAALVLAVGIVAILLAIGFTFYFVTRGELYSAELSLRQAQGDQLLRGAMNIAMSVLNNDVEQHPFASSTDHTWRSLFNGAWIAGKPWGVRQAGIREFNLRAPFQFKGNIPHVDISRLWANFPNLRDYMTGLPVGRRFLYVRFADGYSELLYNGPRSREWLFYPRIEGYNAPVLYDLNAELIVPGANPSQWDIVPQRTGSGYLYYRLNINAETLSEITRDGDLPRNSVPFLLPSMFGAVRYPDGTPVFGGQDKYGISYEYGSLYAPEWVNAWADVDLNGDGYKDAVWLPMAGDKIFSGLVYDAAGEVRDNLNDGLDNNLNGLIDEAPDNRINEEEGPFFSPSEQLLRDDPTDKSSDGKADPEEVFETAPFIYWGGNDGLDNNCDGGIDDNSEQKAFLAAPLPGLRMKVDWNADGVIDRNDMVPDENGNLVYLEVIMPSSIEVVTPNGRQVLTPDDVDCLDNDYDLITNNFDAYAYIGPNNLTGFFTIKDPDENEPIQLPGPPFALKGFVDSGTYQGAPIYDRTKVNQDDARFDYRYAKYAMPGNWNTNDTIKFRSARNASFVEINHFLAAGGNSFLPGVQVYPQTGKYRDYVASIDRTLNYERLIPYIHITHTGEPVCDLVGRMAVYIEDESKKVNLNIAGGHYPIDFNFSPPNPTLADKLRRVYFEPGLSSPWLIGYGLETRFLPRVGELIPRKFWNLLTGAPQGEIDSSKGDYKLNINNNALYYDAAFPGYGVVDDNANAFLLLTNGLDDDGDGIIDNGVRDLLGILEGIDEPGEFQSIIPYQNKVAERDGVDNNGNGQIDEAGELSDRIISTHDQINELDEIGEPGSISFEKIKPTITALGLSKNTQVRQFGNLLRGINPVNINYALPAQIASTLLLSEKPISSIDTVKWRELNPVIDDSSMKDAGLFAQGLRNYEYEWNTWFPIRNGEPGFLFNSYNESGEPISALDTTTDFTFPVDPILKVMQLAVNLTDLRDNDCAQTRLTTEKYPSLLTTEEGLRYSPSQNSTTLSSYEKGHNPTNFPLREMEQYVKNTLGERNISWSINDEWWASKVQNGVNQEGTAPLGDLRTISYTVAGVESIRVTELMVRPVRRLEAEMPIYRSAYNSYLNDYPPGIPLFLADVVTMSGSMNDNYWSLANNNTFDKQNYFVANREYYEYEDPGTEEIILRPNIIEFRIRATNSLPSGRYYLMINTQNEAGEPTLVRGDNKSIKYAIKYCQVNVNNADNLTDDTLAVPSIIDDVINPDPNQQVNVNDDSVFQRIQDSWIGVNARGETTGMVFLPGQLETNPSDPIPDYYWLDGILPEERPLNGKTFTVTVPNYTPNDGDNTNDYELCIAFWVEDSNGGDTFALNFFDFSQEPDHEYVELTNISDNPIDLTGYTLEIGIPRDQTDSRSDPYKVTAKIEDHNNVNNRYIIAPKGRLLLTFDSVSESVFVGDKFDHFQNPDMNPISWIKKNGIGVCGVTPVNNEATGFEPLIYVTTPFIGFNATDNVFRRAYNNGLEADFIDYDSNGATGDNLADVDIQSTPNEMNFTLSGGNKAWDRIVPLYSVEFPLIDGEHTKRQKTDDINTLDSLAKLVLQGGILPNYPEHDGYDNDGDGGYWSDTTGGYVRGTLERDGVDNNLNGLIDEWPLEVSDGIDNNQNGFVDENEDDLINNPILLLFNEGVDEGRLGYYNNGRTYGYGGYEQGMLPVFYLENMFANAGNVPVDFIYDPTDPDDITVELNYHTDKPETIAYYFGTDDDPPQWKAFVERRWNPGDCVVVCLYDERGNLVDGVSYNENDVINRSIDDILPAPAGMQLNANFSSSWWTPDNMLWDFYRSLNRKHPELSGDRFGLSNRWEATDGYYDDWEESSNYLEQIVNVMLNEETPNNFPLYGYTNNKGYRDKRDIAFVINTYHGTPLGKSFSEINLENKDYFSNSLPNVPVINGRTVPLMYPYWKIQQRHDLGTVYAGTLAQMKLPVQKQYLYSSYRMRQVLNDPAYRYLFDLGRQNLTFYRPSESSFWRQVWTSGNVLASQFQGQNELSRVIKGASSMLTTSEKVLTVGTADFVPIRPNPNETNVFPSGADFEDVLNFDLTTNTYPEAWAPLFLFMFDNENYTYPRFVDGSFWGGYPTPYPVLFNVDTLISGNSAFGRNGVNANDIAQRWGIQKRIFAYASSYYRKYLTEQNRPEALFIWDANDGIENGDYYVYINVVNEAQLKRLREYDSQTPTSGLYTNNFGKLWINRDYDPTIIKLALEVITDPAQTRGVRNPGSNAGTGLTHPDDWFRTVDINGNLEDVVAYQPNKNGIISYGKQAAAGWQPQMITVKQKFIALRVRNVGDAPCFLTHIVLAPSKTSLHKINVNTVEPYTYTDGTKRRVFASSMCLPNFYYPSISIPKDEALGNPEYGTNPIPGVNASYENNSVGNILSALHLSYLLATNRPEHVDGRYYSSPLEISNTIGSKYLSPLSVSGDYANRVGDVLPRFESIADHISLRSDVFKITTLVQSGYGVDANGDGFYSYRTNEEFVSQSEAKASIIYERSVPVARYEEN